MPLLAYVDRWNLRPADTVQVMVSGPPGTCSAELVRIVGGGPRRTDTPDAFAFDPVGPTVDARVDTQEINPGSYLQVDEPITLPEVFTVTCSVWPTRPGHGRQAIWGVRDATASLVLGLDESGRLELSWSGSDRPDGPGAATLDTPLLERAWYDVAATVDRRSGEIRLTQRCVTDWTQGRSADTVAVAPPLPLGSFSDPVVMVLGCAGTVATGSDGQGSERPQDVFNGKLGGFRLSSGSVRLVEWDFGLDTGAATVVDVSGNGHSATLIGGPMRAVTGRSWDGSVLDPALAGDQYDAVYFHDDDVDDMAWSPSFSLTVPADSRSGLYAVRLMSADDESFVPVFVRPAAHQPRARVAVVLPTFTYLAYSNYVVGFDDIEFYTGEARDRDPADAYLRAHPELGLSLYNRHSDGSGIHRVSRLRPMPNLDPRHRFWISGGGWTVGGDLYLLDWLEHEGIDYDVLTDDDLHVEGADLLAAYRTVLTGAHPEYSSAAILDAYQGYASGGGRIMYLGGNGFYWVASPMPNRTEVLEVRRGYAGTRAWQSLPGELHLSGTGEVGGLWRHRGRAPQRIFGVGFAAQGGGDAAGFRRTVASEDAENAFIFAGVSDAEVFGTYGNNLGGAAGCEIDRMDHALGTPRNARLVATSAGLHSDFYQNAIEENLVMWPGRGGRDNTDVRADVVYFDTPEGGSVFSVGSIDWTAGLSFNGYDNDIARITGNVLRAFTDRRPSGR